VAEWRTVRFWLIVAIAFALLGANIWKASARPQEGTAAACDNNRAGKSKGVDHTCECARAEKDCKPDDPELKQPGSMCKTYCKPDHCDCQNRCTS
jgi:hypothetical protein